ncbi:MAG: riboflavin synthase [Opitutaceae bacterium]|nr:riboflavin synthase [Opitutaceae bacterium]
MFTGIVEEKGRVIAFAPGRAAWNLRVAAAAILPGLALGDSVAVNGCCLTVAGQEAGAIGFDVLEETRRLTNFAALKEGQEVNLERSLRFDGRMGGHFVSGHIDGCGRVECFEPRGRDHYLRVVAPAGSGRYLVPKGSVAIDGVSLTVAEVTGDTFSVWLIPTTLKATNLAAKRAGDLVNLEFDLLGKYVEKMLAGRPR